MAPIQPPACVLSNVTPDRINFKLDTISKPLPHLIQKVVHQEEEEQEEQEEPIKKLNTARLDKPLPDNVPPPPSPPLEDNLVQPTKPLEEEYPLNPEDTFSKEYRERNNSITFQWYFDEYSGIYRQSASDLHQSMSTLPPSPNLLKRKPTKLLSRSSSTLWMDNAPSLSQQASSTIGDIEEEEEEWQIPKTIEEVHQLRKKARATKDRRKQLGLCRILMDTACRSESVHVTESLIPGAPSVNTRYQHQELRRKKKKDLMLDEVLVLEAQKILKRLAIGGGGIGLDTDSDAQFLLANCYGIGGLGLPVDRERAFSLYIHASKQNHVESTYRAGVCYELGVGTTKDYTRAMTYYRKAATQLHVASMYKLAVILLRGFCGQTINAREAMTWLQRAASLATAEHPHALYLLGMFHLSEEFAINNLIVIDPSYGLELLHESALLNYVPSQVKLGELYEQGGVVEVDDVQSIYWYTRAAEQGNADAALALSSWYLTGSSGILPQSDQEAYLWARKAAACQTADRWSIAKAYFLVGTYVDKGVGTKQATKEAKIWFKRAAALGHRGAIQMI
jgi:TPR repeat protein